MTARYRVWCLSWEDGEEDGRDVVAYDVLTHDYERERNDAIYVADTVLHGPADAAKAYADYAHRRRDGYECTWPLLFRVQEPDGSFQDFEVDREYVPEFTAHPADMSPALHVLWSGRALCQHGRLRGVPGSWPQGHRWISLKDVADGVPIPPDQSRCQACFARAPGVIEGLRQIGADR